MGLERNQPHGPAGSQQLPVRGEQAISGSEDVSQLLDPAAGGVERASRCYHRGVLAEFRRDARGAEGRDFNSRGGRRQLEAGEGAETARCAQRFPNAGRALARAQKRP